MRKIIGSHPQVAEVSEETLLFFEEAFRNLIDSRNPVHDLGFFFDNFDRIFWARPTSGWGGEWVPGLHNHYAREVIDNALGYLGKNYPGRQPNKVLASFMDMLFLHGHDTFVEKTPLHCLHIDKIRKLYPNAIVVYMRRDIENIVESLPEQNWFRPLNVDPRKYTEYILAKAQQCINRDRNVVEIQLEALVESPEPHLRRLVESGLPETGIGHLRKTFASIVDENLVFRRAGNSDKRVN